MKPDCNTCLHPMTGNNGQQICRWYGLPLSPALEAVCKQYTPKTAANAAREWACIVDWMQGRGD